MKADELRPAVAELTARIPVEKDRRVQRPLVRALAAIARPGDSKALDLFEKMVEDNDPKSSKVVVDALATLAPDRLAAKVKTIGDRLRGGNDKERRAAARLLGRLGTKAVPAVPDLATAVEKDGNAKVRREAADALGSIHFPANEQAIPALVRVIQGDPEPIVRQRSVWALRSLPDLDKFEATGPLEALLRLDRPSYLPTSYSAAMLLAMNKGPKASTPVVGSLMHLLHNKSIKVSQVFGIGNDSNDGRYLAVKPLAKMFRPDRPFIRERLEAAAMDPEPRLKKEAQEALKTLK
jgi:HEAT repeat protein